MSVELQPGRHTMATSIGSGPLVRKQKFELPLEAGGGYRDAPEVHAQLTYSRITGNFDKRISLSTKR